MGKQVVKLRSNIAWYFFWTFSQILAIFFPWLMVPIKWPKWRAQDCQDILAGKKISTSWRKHLWSLQLPNYTVEYSKEQNWQEFARIWIRSVMSVASKTNNCSCCFIHSYARFVWAIFQKSGIIFFKKGENGKNWDIHLFLLQNYTL